MSTTGTPWIKASASDATGSCVEMRSHDGQIQVRDTKQHGQGPILNFPVSQFSTWVDAAKRGELDQLTS